MRGHTDTRDALQILLLGLLLTSPGLNVDLSASLLEDGVRLLFAAENAVTHRCIDRLTM